MVCGVTIGAWAFVAAGAGVTKDLPEYALMAGVPALAERRRRAAGGGRMTTLQDSVESGVPVLDLGPETGALWDGLTAVVQAVIRAGYFTMGRPAHRGGAARRGWGGCVIIVAGLSLPSCFRAPLPPATGRSAEN